MWIRMASARLRSNFLARGIGFALLPKAPADSVAEIMRSGRQMCLSVSNILRTHRNSVPRKTSWNEATTTLGLTVVRARRIVRLYQGIAVVCVMFLAFVISGLAQHYGIVASVGTGWLSLTYYARAVLRLYQIRSHELCSFGSFCQRVLLDPRQILPLGIKADWRVQTGGLIK